jgi:hypothetical protein
MVTFVYNVLGIIYHYTNYTERHSYIVWSVCLVKANMAQKRIGQYGSVRLMRYYTVNFICVNKQMEYHSWYDNEKSFMRSSCIVNKQTLVNIVK